MNFTLAVQTLDSRITPSIDLFLQVKKGITDMNRLPSLDEYFAAAERGEVSALYSPDRKYVKFKYTAQAIYSSRWNRVTLHARGHVFNVSTGECVLRPWDKFFNFNELVFARRFIHSHLSCLRRGRNVLPAKQQKQNVAGRTRTFYCYRQTRWFSVHCGISRWQAYGHFVGCNSFGAFGMVPQMARRPRYPRQI